MKVLHQIPLLQHRIIVYGDEAAFRQLFVLLILPLRQFAFAIIYKKQLSE